MREPIELQNEVEESKGERGERREERRGGVGVVHSTFSGHNAQFFFAACWSGFSNSFDLHSQPKFKST
jgi:hypothetical protein